MKDFISIFRPSVSNDNTARGDGRKNRIEKTQRTINNAMCPPSGNKIKPNAMIKPSANHIGQSAIVVGRCWKCFCHDRKTSSRFVVVYVLASLLFFSLFISALAAVTVPPQRDRGKLLGRFDLFHFFFFCLSISLRCSILSFLFILFVIFDLVCARLKKNSSLFFVSSHFENWFFVRMVNVM